MTSEEFKGAVEKLRIVAKAFCINTNLELIPDANAAQILDHAEHLAAEVDRLTASLERNTRTLICRDCNLPWSIDEDAKTCDSAHEENWPHDWIDNQHRQFIHELLKRHNEIKRLTAENAELRKSLELVQASHRKAVE